MSFLLSLVLLIRGDAFFKSVGFIGYNRFDFTGKPFGFELSSKVDPGLVLIDVDGGLPCISEI